MDPPSRAKFSDVGTFGFELEFLVYLSESNTKTREAIPSDQQALQEPYDSLNIGGGDHELHVKRLHHFGAEIAAKLTEAGIATAYKEKGHPKVDDAPKLNQEDARLGSFDEFCYSSYKKCTIVPEETMIWTDPNKNRMAVRPETEKGHFWLGFEFVSKVYQYRDLHSMKLQLETVCKELRANYSVSINAGKDSMHGSSRCSVHVHWGVSGKEYSLLSVKRILTLMWVTEDTLMGLHATWRRDAKKYSALLQQGTNMAADKVSNLPGWIDNLGKGDWSDEMEQNIPARVRDSLHENKPKVQWIWRAGTIDDLVMLVGEVNKSRRASVAITELLPADSDFTGKVRRSQLNTIEFRHMQGSLNPALVSAWIEVTASIMRRCIDMSAQDFTSFMEDISACVSNKNSSVQDLLDQLGIAPEIRSIFRSFDQKYLDKEADSRSSVFLPGL
ncbi:uncharacterized protein GGS22DRAFT_178382 [Annulohypoxylon maeteangense]|uniref:uncharacterized protein n=1 Tax=Annulohypoxylon maeteangense TaxID=1927788 RepID=UPI002008D2FC|nr:uncharacterized protein GGS22DRAFT_178382 [Annulohypoxylon maeteangense]KAI0887171.1 hypothetical protein GGS22DRAFT_178382 [Annulohypoxylon maeteangense]